jgi:hypothetical protein
LSFSENTHRVIYRFLAFFNAKSDILTNHFRGNEEVESENCCRLVCGGNFGLSRCDGLAAPGAASLQIANN